MTPTQNKQLKSERASKCAICDKPAEFYCLQYDKLLCQEDKQVTMQLIGPALPSVLR